MRIHSLQITNIASLKGVHFIDFDELFSTSGLFAITGKTGAGKSTILNCISLALYGKNYKSNTHNYDFVTLGEREGAITLRFSSLNKVYQAHWKLKLRKANGEALKKPQLARELFHEIEQGQTESLDTLPESVINLDFNQFCRTTILNQGEFAKFLTSPFTERKDILEKFYEGEKLTTVGLILKQKLKNSSANIEEKEANITGLGQSFEDIDLTQSDLKTEKLLLRKSDRINSFTTDLFKSHKDLSDLYKSKSTNEQRLKENKEKSSLVQDQLNKSLKSQKELMLKQDDFMLSYPAKTQALQKAREQEIIKDTTLQKTEQNKINKNKIQTRLDELVYKITELTEQKDEIILTGKRTKDSISHLENITLLKAREDLRLYIKLEQELIHQKKNQKRTKENIQIEKDASYLIEKEISELLKKTDQSPKEKTIAGQKETREELERVQKDIGQLLFFENEQKEITIEIENMTSPQLEEKERELGLAKKESQKLEEDLSRAKNALNFFKLQAAIMLCHEDSQDKGACNVCGSTIDVLQTKETIDQKEHQKAETHFENISELEKRVSEKLITLKTSHALIKEKLKQQKTKSQQSSKAIDSILKQYQNQYSNPEELKSFELELKRKDKEFTELILRLEYDSKQLAEAKDEIKMKTKTLMGLNELLKAETKLSETHHSQLEKLKDIYKLDNKAPLLSFESLVKAKEKVIELKTKYTHCDQKLKSLHEQKTAAKKDLGSLLEQIEEEKKLIKKSLDFIKTNTTTGQPSTELKELESQKEVLQSQITKENERLKELEIKSSEMKSKQENFKDQITQSELLIKQTTQALKEAPLIFNATELKQLSDPMQEFFNRANSIYEKIIQNINESSSTLDVLQSSLSQTEDLKNKIQELHLEQMSSHAQNAALFERKEKTKGQIKEITALLAKDKAQHDALIELNQVIGKDEFRSYILAIIEKLLIEQTNLELQKLCSGRYRLNQYQKDSRMSTEFKIIDFHHDGMERKITTLSGGETFLVSLAMALALAELMRGNSEIDSLFIDEGFGTLDRDSIEDAFELLQTIQFSGKQVGVISHVKDLTDRIPVNIFLQKDERRQSKIEVRYN